MKNCLVFFLLLLAASCSLTSKRDPASGKKRILVFGKTNRPAHIHIVPGVIKHLVSHFQNNNFEAVGSQDTSSLLRESLSKFDALIFVDVSNGMLSEEQKRSVENFVSSGKGLLAIHASIAAGNDWEWFKEMIGTSFLDHPPIQSATVQVMNKYHQWVQNDEWYNFTSDIGSEFTVQAIVDEQSYKGGKMGDHHPISWRREIPNQKVWFIAMGHDESLYVNYEHDFIKHILEAADWATNSK